MFLCIDILSKISVVEYVGCIILFMPFTKYQASGGKFLYHSSKNMSVVNGFCIVVKALIGAE